MWTGVHFNAAKLDLFDSTCFSSILQLVPIQMSSDDTFAGVFVVARIWNRRFHLITHSQLPKSEAGKKWGTVRPTKGAREE